ncbi:MAG: hypothetical protein US60_C0009G0007 [Microgenomates group bacterium GW2011_GWC1_37_8]|uniref:DUF5678 domain-containing protein n=1 Tax=Candidatus Woesebacteria bacterium GW2011_GWB1_38_8 TaxID=1618570 RepID=A0A0G0L1U3_9BACT|nr:MAG: hypothetical protein US60_C0009G0007 [Microgenomates group bacterium GW2011_GWC1_37_8]KKQ85948.1 MAG: hypothetical protein UT08_C0003G0111 [Candidatus Woesebacteria bacterium GW2011_GWB1_38_8]
MRKHLISPQYFPNSANKYLNFRAIILTSMLKLHEPSEGEKKYYLLKNMLEKKYEPNDYVVINPKTNKYFVGKTSIEAMKKARSKYPKGKLFMAQVGRISGLLK